MKIIELNDYCYGAFFTNYLNLLLADRHVTIPADEVESFIKWCNAKGYSPCGGALTEKGGCQVIYIEEWGIPKNTPNN